MTYKEKLDKLVAKIKWLIGDYNIKTEKYRGINEQAHQYYGWKRDALSEILKSIDTMQKEPKECMYSKDNYTDEDRKALCDGCEEECRFNKKEETVSEIDFEQELYKHFGQVKDFTLGMRIAKKFYEIGRNYQEPVSENLEAAIDAYLATYWGGDKEKQDWPYLKKMAIHFANWQKEEYNELTWEDMSKIRQIMFDYNAVLRAKMCIPNDEDYCKEILRRYK